jgi:type IV pilus assembly protein PilA
MKTMKSKKAFTLIELVVVIAILGILAAILVPVISGFIETANQSADNANARLVYQASAMWFASNNAAKTLTYTDLGPFMGSGSMPTAKSQAFAGAFTSAVAADGTITVRTAKPATYHPGTGKLGAGSTTP